MTDSSQMAKVDRTLGGRAHWQRCLIAIGVLASAGCGLLDDPHRPRDRVLGAPARPRRLEGTFLSRHVNGRSPVVHLELAHRAPQVRLHRLRAQAQLRRDLRVGRPDRDEPQRVEFTW